MQYNKVVSQKYKKLFSSYFIRRTRLAGKVNLNAYLSAVTYFRLVVRNSILSIRRKRPTIVRRSSFYSRVIGEELYKLRFLKLLKLRNLLKNRIVVYRHSNKNYNVNSLTTLVYTSKLKRLNKLSFKLIKKISKKLRFSTYKRISRSFIVSNPLNLLNLKLNHLSKNYTYIMWLNLLRVKTYSESKLLSILSALRSTVKRKVKQNFSVKKFLLFSSFSRILGKRIRRVKLYVKRSRILNNNYFLYDLHRSRLFSNSFYPFLIKNYFYKKKLSLRVNNQRFSKRKILYKGGFYRAQNFNARLTGNSTFKIPKKFYITRNVSRLLLKMKSVKSRRIQLRIDRKRYRTRKFLSFFNRLSVKQPVFNGVPCLRIVSKKIRRRKIRRIKKRYLDIKRKRRFKFFSRRKKHKKKTMGRRSRLSYRFKKIFSRYTKKNLPFKVMSLIGKKRRRLKRRIKFYQFSTRNLARSSVALSKVDRKLFRRRRFSHYYGRRFLIKNLRRYNRKLLRSRTYKDKKFSIKVNTKHSLSSIFINPTKNLSPLNKFYFRKVKGLFKRIVKELPLNNFSMIRLPNLFSIRKIRTPLNCLVSNNNYSDSFNLRLVLPTKVRKFFPSLFKRESLISFVKEKVTLLQFKVQKMLFLYDKSIKDSVFLTTYNYLFRELFSSIFYIKHILLSTELKERESKTLSKINLDREAEKSYIFIRASKLKAPRILSSFRLKIKIFGGLFSLYRRYRITKVKMLSKRLVRSRRLRKFIRKIKLKKLKIRLKKLGFLRKTQFYKYMKLRSPILRNRSDIWIQPNVTIHNFRSLLAKRGLLFKTENLIRDLTLSIKFNKRLNKFKKGLEIHENLLIWFLNRFRPIFGVKPKRKGSAIVQTPMLLTSKRSISLGHRQFIKSFNKRPEYSIDKRILAEIVGTVEKRSSTYKNLTEQLKLTYANRVLL